MVWLFFKIYLCSAISFESSRRDLVNDMAERRSILKNNQNTYYPSFKCIPKTALAFHITDALFYYDISFFSF